MGESHPDPTALLTPAPPEPFSEGFIIRAQFVLDGHSLVGDVRCSGAPRRLVDILNSMDDPFFEVRDGELREVGLGADPPAPARRFDVLHVQRSLVLFAVPITAPPPLDSSEMVAKRSVAASLVLPGWEISGSIYFPLEGDPRTVRLVANREFIPVTGAEIKSLGGGDPARREDAVVVSFRRLMLYALNGGLAQRSAAGSSAGAQRRGPTPPKRTRRNSST